MKAFLVTLLASTLALCAWSTFKAPTVWVDAGQNGYEEIFYAQNHSLYVTLGGEGSIKTWRTSDNRFFNDYNGFDSPRAMDLSRDQTMLAYVTPSRLVVLRMPDLAVLLSTEIGGNLRDVQFDALNRPAVSRSNGTIQSYTLAGTPLSLTSPAGSEVRSIFLDAGRDEYVGGLANGQIVVWSSAGTLLRSFSPHATAINDLEPAGGGRVLTASADGTSKLVDTVTGQAIQTFSHGPTVNKVRLSPDGSRVLTTNLTGVAKLWNIANGALLHTWSVSPTSLRSGTFSADSTQVYLAPFDQIRGFSTVTGSLLFTTNRPNSSVDGVQYSPDGTRIAAVDGPRVRVYDAATGALQLVLTGHTFDAAAVAWRPDGTQIASSGFDATIRIHDATTGALVRTLTHTSIMRCLDWRNNTTVAGGSDNGIIRVWSTINGITLAQYNHGGLVYAVQYSPDGSLLAAGGSGNEIKLWDPSTGTVTRTLTGHTSVIRDLDWRADGLNLLSASSDGTAKVWATTSSSALRTFNSGTSSLSSARYIGSGINAVASSFSGQLFHFRVSTGNVLAEVESSTGISFKMIDTAPDGTQFVFGRFDATVVAYTDPLATSPRRVRAFINPQNFVGPTFTSPVTLTARRPSDNSLIGTGSSALVNNFAEISVNALPQPIDVVIEVPKYLRARIEDVPFEWNEYFVQATLFGGDVDEDNEITIFDYIILSEYFDRDSSQAGWNTVGANGFAPSDADLDGDGAVTIFDYLLISENFGLTGA